ncbi:MAG: PepSY-associated TM helix domain-containing protein [Verrucomicrobiota bacterium]
MKTKTIWKLHSWLGLLAGIPLLVIALSGSLLVFKDDLNRLLIPGKVFVESRPEGPLPMAERLAALQEGLPEHEVVGWALYDEPERSDWVYVMAHGDDEWLHVYQNPYTGEILGEPVASDSEFMGWLLELHYTFLAGHVGMAVCGESVFSG